MWSFCDASANLNSDLLYDRTGPEAKFAKTIKEIGQTLGITFDRSKHAYVVKQNISEQDMKTVSLIIGSAHRLWLNIPGHIRLLIDLYQIRPIIHMLNLICDRLKDGQDWRVNQDDPDEWKLYIMNEDNAFREEKNPVYPNPPEDSTPNFPPNDPNEHYPDEIGNPPLHALLRQLEYYI